MHASPRRSTFVTVLAWFFIAMAAMATAISIMQNVMLRMLMDGPMGQALDQAPPEGVPPVAALLAGHAQLFFLGFMLASIATLACSIGLLHRREWARRGFVALMGLGIAWQAVGVWLQSSLAATMRGQFAAAAELGGPDLGAAASAIMLAGVLFALGMAGLQGWIAWKLLTPAIAAEFRR